MIVSIALKYGLLNESIQFDFQSILYGIICKTGYQLTEKQCREILSIFPTINQHRGITALFGLVASRMKESGWISNRRFELNKNKPMPNWQLLNEMYVYYDIVTDEERERIITIIKEMILSDADLKTICAFIVNKHTYNLVTHDLVERIARMSGHTHSDSIRCKTLKEVYLNSSDTGIKNEILEISKKDSCLNFFLTPLSYGGQIDIHWLKYIDDECFKTLIKREDVFQAIKQSGVDEDIRKRFWELL